MAYEIPGFSFPLPSGADFTGGAQFRFCDVNANGQVVNPGAAGDVVGVRQNRPKVGEATTVVQSGIVFVEAGDAITAGAKVTTDNVGRAVAATAGQVTHGRALEGASAAGIQIAVLLIPNSAAVA